jgi:hypothetical protein
VKEAIKRLEKWLAYTLPIVIILAVGVVKFGYHELWKDEWQAWFVSRDLGVSSMLSFLYYEGHPALWYIWLKPFSWIFDNGEIGLKFSHFLAFAISIIVLFKLKGPIWFKVLFALSYQMAFEYGVVSRGYILVVLLGLVLIDLIQRSKSRTILFYILLFLLCQTEVQGVFLSAAFLVYLYSEERNLSVYLRSIAAFVIGLVTFVITVFPRTDRGELSSAYSAEAFSIDSWLIAFQGLTANTFLPGIVGDTSTFGVSWLTIIAGLVLLSVRVWLFSHKRQVLFFFASFWMASLLFHSVIYNGGLRHWSMVLVIFGLSILLKPNMLKDGTKRAVIILMFLAPVFYSGKAFFKDIQQPYTNAKAAGLFIKDKVPAEVPIVAINKFECAPVGGYAQRQLYALPDGMPFSYFKWVEKVYIPTQHELQLFAEYKNVKGLIIISPRLLETERFPGIKIWETFDKPDFKHEQYVLYLIEF